TRVYTKLLTPPLFSSTLSTIALSGGFMYSPTMSRTFGANSGSLLNLNDSTRWGCSLCFFQIRCTVSELTFWLVAMARTLQCVAFFGIVFIVASTMATSCSPEMRLGRHCAAVLREAPSAPHLHAASPTPALWVLK